MLWLDVESTDVDVEECDLLEVGFVRTDKDLNPIAKTNVVINQTTFVAIEKVFRMHTENGLFSECRRSLLSLYEAERFLIEWVDLQWNTGQPVVLSDHVAFDKGVLERCMPKLHARLGHRYIDVSNVRRLSRLWYDYESPIREESRIHRAIDCIARNIQEMRDYRGRIFKLPRPALLI